MCLLTFSRRTPTGRARNKGAAGVVMYRLCDLARFGPLQQITRRRWKEEPKRGRLSRHHAVHMK